jgi:hypothetical protein
MDTALLSHPQSKAKTPDRELDDNPGCGREKAVRYGEWKGQYSPFAQEVRWTLESSGLRWQFLPLQVEKTIRDTQVRRRC